MILAGKILAAASESTITDILSTVSNWVLIGGGLWAVFGAVTLASGLKDHNGPGIQNGVWQLVGAGLIIAASALFKTLV